MVKLDFDLERDVPELTGKVLLITDGKSPTPRGKIQHNKLTFVDL